MMKRFAAVFFLPFVFSGAFAVSNEPVDCRVIVGGMRECTPYSNKLLKAKEVSYQKLQKKLIVDKTLPVPKKKKHLKVISVEDMIERYVKVEDSKRYRGTASDRFFRKLKREEARKKEEEEKKKAAASEKVDEPLVSVEENNLTKPEVKEIVAPEGKYTVKSGDVLSKIALMFGMKTKDLMQKNNLKQKDQLKIGQKLTLPFSQEKIDAIASARYKVKEGDSLISIAKKFELDPKLLAKYNHIKNTAQIKVGKTLKLPLPYIQLAEKKKETKHKGRKEKQPYGSKLIRSFGKHKLRVTATAYSSHGNQTDSTPFLAAWNNRLRPGMKVIAVSRDLLYKYGMKNGTKVKIAGLPGYYRVRDKMNKRYKKRIDIYMGTNRRKALRWGRRSVVIYW
jgi:LysM repeat protein